MSIVTKFAKFAGKYAGELSTVANALSLLLGNLPIPRAEKGELEAAVAALQSNAENILAGLKDISETAVKLTASDRRDIAAMVAGMLKPELEKLIADQATAAAVDATSKLIAAQAPAPDASDETGTES